MSNIREVLLVKFHDLQLRHEQLGWGQQTRLVSLESADQIQLVAHREAVNEHIDLTGILLVVKEQAAPAIEGIESLVPDVAQFFEKCTEPLL
jgi:hypothetical protein